MEFVTFTEHNHKENETFVFYLQWTGNEAALTLLQRAVDMSDISIMDGDYSSFTMNNEKIPESIVNQQCKLTTSNNFHRMYTKCTGTFACPLVDDYEDELKENTASLLDEMFYTCHIEKLFSDYRNYYEEYLYGKITKEEYDASVSKSAQDNFNPYIKAIRITVSWRDMTEYQKGWCFSMDITMSDDTKRSSTFWNNNVYMYDTYIKFCYGDSIHIHEGRVCIYKGNEPEREYIPFAPHITINDIKNAFMPFVQKSCFNAYHFNIQPGDDPVVFQTTFDLQFTE